jgi:dihydroxyacetone kinase
VSEARGIVPKRIFNGPFMGSMNMPGISLSLLNLTNIAEECSFTSTAHLLELIDAPHNTPAWPATQNIYPVPPHLAQRKRADMFTEVEQEVKVVHADGPKMIGELDLRPLTGIVDAG